MCIRERTTAMDAKLTIAPPPLPRDISSGIAAWHMKNAVLKFTAISRSRISGFTSVNGPKLKNPPATLTRMSRPPKCDCAAAVAARAAAGCVRSPADALAAMPSAANSFTRSARPTALTSASSNFAPARPKPRATAWPIWPTRPTPVMSATMPCRSSVPADLHGKVGLITGVGRVGHGRGATLRESDGSVPADDVDGPLNSFAIVLQRVVCAGDRPLGIGEERKVEPHLLDIAAMAVDAGGVHAQRLHLGGSEFGDLIAHGGELAVSAGGIVARIEDQRHRPVLQQVAERVGLAVGRGRVERRCLAADR